MAMLMFVDAFRAASEEQQPALYLWALAMVLFIPVVWVYYVVRWRPRHAGA